ncbi:MAG: 2,3-bisphosphoglycerate-independent phosphoglycerate mutase, partial [Oscillospiraceae bacterium]
MNQAPVLLMILDGCGLRKETAGNAVAAAKKPNLERLWRAWPHTTLGASGLDVGLPDGQMGNSEVGHTNLGAGRIVYQELTRISKSIADGDFFSNPALCAACDAAGSTGTLHLMGLLSDGGVHSHLEHLFALISLARRRGVRKLAVHCFMDGRDTDPHAGAAYLGRLEQALEQDGL